MNNVDEGDPRPEDSVSHLVADWMRERPDIDPLTIGMFARIHRLSSHLESRARGWLEAEGLTWETFSLIVTLRRQGAPYALRPTDILRESLLTSGAVTNRIDKVERLGLVERRPAHDDKRATIVRLTRDGVKKADAAISSHAAHLGDAFGLADLARMQELDALLAHFLALMETPPEAGSKEATDRAEAAQPDP